MPENLLTPAPTPVEPPGAVGFVKTPLRLLLAYFVWLLFLLVDIVGWARHNHRDCLRARKQDLDLQLYFKQVSSSVQPRPCCEPPRLVHTLFHQVSGHAQAR